MKKKTKFEMTLTDEELKEWQRLRLAIEEERKLGIWRQVAMGIERQDRRRWRARHRIQP